MSIFDHALRAQTERSQPVGRGARLAPGMAAIVIGTLSLLSWAVIILIVLAARAVA